MAATKPSSKRVIAMISTWLHRLLRKAPPDHKEPLTAPAWPWADELAWLYEPTETPCGELAPYFLTQLNTLWPDLDDARGINMNSRRGYANAVAYWESPLRQHCPDIVWPRSEFPPVLFEPDAQTDQDGPLPFSLGLVAILNVRPDMGDFECHSRLGRIRMLHWRLTLGSKEYRHLAFTPEELAQLQRPCQQHAGRLAHLSKLAELLPALYTHLPDRLQPLLEGDRLAFDACWKESGDGLLAALHSAPRIGQSLEYTPPPDIGTAEANGINVVGFATGQFGVGEDARMATRVLIQAGLKPCVYEPPIPLAVAHRQSGWIDQHMQPEPAYRFNLITLLVGASVCMNHIRSWEYDKPAVVVTSSTTSRLAASLSSPDVGPAAARKFASVRAMPRSVGSANSAEMGRSTPHRVRTRESNWVPVSESPPR